MIIKFVDLNPEVIEALAEEFHGCEVEGEVHFMVGDIFSAPRSDALMSPSNSLGWLNGGIDGVYVSKFGHRLSENLQKEIKTKHSGLLEIGKSAIIQTDNSDYPFVVFCPTMEVPGADVSYTENAYLAFKAGLEEILAYNKRVSEKVESVGSELTYLSITSVSSPGFCTLNGLMSPETSAKQIKKAYQEVFGL